jgi:hypothetical protein
MFTRETGLRRGKWLVASAASILMLAGGARWGRAEEPTRTFSSAGEACRALFHAVRDDDAQALEAILGRELTSSGAESEDRLERQRFDTKYAEMHRLVREPDGATRLYVGAENWPFPVPLVADDGRWRFDTEGGQREILLRRVGHDETAAMRVCETLARKTQHRPEPTGDDPIARYAEGLLASADGGAPAQEPFHGYYFRVVPKRAGAEKSRGPAFVAYPAEYRASGVMTFVVDDDGTLWEKDLGPTTPIVAPDLSARPAAGWHEVKPERG